MRRLLVDTTPLCVSSDFRRLWLGQAVSFFGTMITTAALPYQVFHATNSSLAVGLLGLAQLGPLLVFSLIGGAPGARARWQPGLVDPRRPEVPARPIRDDEHLRPRPARDGLRNAARAVSRAGGAAGWGSDPLRPAVVVGCRGRVRRVVVQRL